MRIVLFAVASLVIAGCSSGVEGEGEGATSQAQLSSDTAERTVIDTCRGAFKNAGQCTACVTKLLDGMEHRAEITKAQKDTLLSRFADGVCRDACVPSTCDLVGARCGAIADGCGGTIDCGCDDADTCGGAGVPGMCGCTPITCEQAGAGCGAIDDGCGGTLECGGCDEGMACQENACVCAPLDAIAFCATKQCGGYTDACGRTVLCGPCRP